MGLIIRSSSIHAAGCYTTSYVAQGTQVVEYTGPRITKEAADARYENSAITYLFGIGDGSTVIDGHGTAMFINHSCDPNCEADERDGRVWIVALRAIAAGDELTYDYNLYDGDEDEAHCNCGAGICRSTMYSPREILRRKRAAKAAAARLAAKTSGKRKSADAAKKKNSSAKKRSAGKKTLTRSVKTKNAGNR